MNWSTSFGRLLFSISWLVIGTQHFLNADILKEIVPPYLPWPRFWIFSSGLIFIVAGIFVMVDKNAALAAKCIVIIVAMFIFLLQLPGLVNGDITSFQCTRLLQDAVVCTIAWTAFGGTKKFMTGKFLFLLAVGIFGVQHIARFEFVTISVPDWLTLEREFHMVVGIVMIVISGSFLIQQYSKIILSAGGAILFSLFLIRLPQLIDRFDRPISWIIAMIELAIIGGVFIYNREGRSAKAIN